MGYPGHKLRLPLPNAHRLLSLGPSLPPSLELDFRRK